MLASPMSETLLKQAITEFEEANGRHHGKTKVSIKTVDAINTPSAPASMGLWRGNDAVAVEYCCLPSWGCSFA